MVVKDYHYKKYEPKDFFIFGFNLSLMLILSYFAFSKNQAYLLFGYDGAYMMELVRQQLKWGFSSFFGFTNNIFQSLGNVYFPLNTTLTLGYLLSAITNGEVVDKVSSYLLFAMEIFCSIYAFCITFRFKQTCAIIASWMFILFTFPYVEQATVYGIFSLVPHFCSGISETFIIMILISKIVREKKISWICSLVTLLLLMHVSVAYPGALILTSPLLCMFTISYGIALTSKSERVLFALTILMIISILAFMGVFHYFLGLFQYTAAVFFQNELLNTRLDWQSVSIAFHYNAHIMGLYLVLLGISGAFIDVFSQRGVRKNMALMLLIYVSCLLSSGFIISYYYSRWQGPLPLYFEVIIWPFYIIYATNFLIYLWLGLKNFIFKKIDNLPKSRFFNNVGLLFPLIVIAIYTPFLYSSIYRKTYNVYPPSDTEITKILRKEIAIQYSAPFRGRVATFTGQNLNKANWFDLHTSDHNQIQEFGNEHRLMGFSYYDIPSFFEYSPLISPAFYLVTKKFLTFPQDEQIRNVMTLRKVNSKILRLLGIRFFITDKIIKTNAKLRYQLKNIFLYELDDVNLGQYSPTNIIIKTDSNASLNAMSAPEFDPKQFAILHNELQELKNLVSATETKINVEKGGILKLSSKSDGHSLLVLPIEYSHCLDLTDTQNQLPIQLFRVNILQAGVLFQGNLDATLKYFTGPLHNANCRLKDTLEAKNLNF